MFPSQGLQAIRCPPGLAFDLEKQTCDWKWAVKNCDELTRERKVKPLLVTDTPLCNKPSELACGDGTCIEKNLFCNGKKDCTDGSDENVCVKYLISWFMKSWLQISQFLTVYGHRFT